MSVYDFCDLCFDTDLVIVNLWDTDKDKTIFRGTMTDVMMSQYAHWNIETYDAIFRNDEITLNVSEQ